MKNISRNDSIRCKVVGQNKNGCFLSINGIEEKPIVRLFDCYLQEGTEVLVSVARIYETHIKVSLDSVYYPSEFDGVA
ncbi:MAG: hypothetical protein FWC78_07405 [Defluviitaleaceae bacterium]|nr:hypothetical protein [Defluviitaleaceae bacterium]